MTLLDKEAEKAEKAFIKLLKHLHRCRDLSPNDTTELLFRQIIGAVGCGHSTIQIATQIAGDDELPPLRDHLDKE